MRTIFEYEDRRSAGAIIPEHDIAGSGAEALLPTTLLRKVKPRIPNLSEPEVIRHYTGLSKLNYGVDDGFYPLGSCTMKYNPKLNEDLARLPGFAGLHPLVDADMAQGTLAVLADMSRLLRGISGMADVTLQPAAGAHGEVTGMFLMKRYFETRGEPGRKRILLPDSAHGTNPASAAAAGFSVTEIRSGDDGLVDLGVLRDELDETVAGIMLTVPNTLGIFEEQILEITEMVHASGGLCYFDGANLNAFLGRARPGDMGADIFHFNLHKTLSTPHGGGGPGSGPVAVSDSLVPFLPIPRIEEAEGRYSFDWGYPQSIGCVHSFYGNFGVIIKAYAYLLTLGDAGLRDVSGNAVLNANYLQEKLKRTYKLPYDRLCKHEFVLSGDGMGKDVSTLDVAKRLIDFGFHPPTIYFPLIVHEALMIEPTESERKSTLDEFAAAMERIALEAKNNPELLRDAPHSAATRRLDQTRAVRQPVLTYPFEQEKE